MTKTEIRKLDRDFSLYIRGRGKCERCGTTRNLQTSHIYSRRYLAVRWLPLNAQCLCASCHFTFWHHKPAEAVEWAKKLFGEMKWEELKTKANTPYNKFITPAEVRATWK